MDCATVTRRLLSFMQTIIATHIRYSQTVVFKDTGAASGLRVSVIVLHAPTRDIFFGFKERQRQQFVRITEAAKPFNANEPRLLFQNWFKCCRVVQIAAQFAMCRHDFEDDGDHVEDPWGKEAQRSHVRSSDRMNFSRWANS